ncbi:SpoIIE family protein phosphatase [Streptomyces sp. NPDC001348]
MSEAPWTATATVDERGVVTGWSDGARRLLGYAAPEIVGHPAGRLLADDTEDTEKTGDTRRAGERTWRQAAGRQRWSGTVALRHRDGHRLEPRVLAHRRTTNAGGAEWLVVSAVAGARPSAGAVLGDRAFAGSSFALAVFDTDPRLVRASAGMERVLALGEEQMRGLRLPEIAPHPLNDRAETTMRLALAGGGPQPVRVCLHPADGQTERGWQGCVTPLEEPDGRLRGVCLAVDVRAELMRQRMLVLGDAGARMGAHSDTRRTAEELAEVAVPRFADVAVVDLLPDRQSGPATTPGGGPPALGRAAVRSVPSTPGQGPAPVGTAGEEPRYPAWSPVAECLAHGRGTVYAGGDVALARWAAEDPQAAWIRRTGTHSLIVVPLRAAGTTLGIALFGRHRRPEPFDADDLWLAEQLVAGAATSIHGSRRPQQHTTTMTLQRSLLPRTLPEQGAVEIATRYLPAAGRTGAGGDWFDVIPLSGTRVALVVGDVVGHGIRATATMGRLRTAVHTLADVDLPPDELLTHLDDLVLHMAADEAGPDGADTTEADVEDVGGVGTTCLYAVYDPVTRRLALACAGHPPPAVVTPDGTVRFLDARPGPPLGLGGLPFEAFETELPEGSLIALYTNGLLQTRGRDMDDALDRVFAALAHPADSPDMVCERVLSTLLTDRPDDDIVLLVARTHALHSDRVATWNLPFDPAVVAHARREVTDRLTAWHLGDAAFVTELVVSELVTNALRYGRPPVRLRLIHTPHTLTCEVTDSSNTTPHMRRAHTYDEGGRGLLLVGQLTHRWGTRHHPTGKTVWTEQFLSTD